MQKLDPLDLVRLKHLEFVKLDKMLVDLYFLSNKGRVNLLSIWHYDKATESVVMY